MRRLIGVLLAMAVVLMIAYALVSSGPDVPDSSVLVVPVSGQLTDAPALDALAWTCCDYADTLRERDAEGDRSKAITMLDESLAISNELGMRPLMERVLSRREILKA